MAHNHDSVSRSALPAIKLSSSVTREFWEIPVIYEDEQLLALNKPAGLAVAPDRADPGRLDLMTLLHQGITDAKPWAAARALSFLMYAHRLDAEATGVLLLAKGKTALTNILDQFGSGRASLVFVTLAAGAPVQDQFSVEAKLASHPAKPGLMHTDAKLGKRSRTSFEVLERFRGWTLLRSRPVPNRAHQVRVHLARAGLRVAGDQAYGGKPLWLSRLKPDYHLKPKHTERPLIGGALVHAEQLSVSHPQTGNLLALQVPWPKNLEVALKYLRMYARVQSS
jgi:RluA family pseudouridine synthase